jgi:hypothetical protein
MFEHMRHSGATIIRIYTMYRPLSVFLLVGNLLIYTGILVGIRFAYFYIIGEGMGHIQSIIFGSILVMVGVQVIMTGLVADLIGINRKLLEDILLRLKRAQLTEKHSKSLK